MGTARAPVVGSAVWPAWTASVASCCWFGSDMMVSFRFVWSLQLGTARIGCGPCHNENGPHPLWDPGRSTSDRSRLTRLPLKSRTEGSAWHTHTHGHDHS